MFKLKITTTKKRQNKIKVAHFTQKVKLLKVPLKKCNIILMLKFKRMIKIFFAYLCKK